MKKRRKLLSLTIFCIFNIAYLQGQQIVTANGGTASGTGGTVTYTVGQTALNNYLSSLYFLKVINGNQEVKVLKIVKN